MKKLVKNSDYETAFFEDEIGKAKEYYGIEEACESLEDVAMWYNDFKKPIEDTGELRVVE